MRRGGTESGFTLAELLVATVLLSLVMGSIYTLFNTTIHGWRLAEDEFQSFQQVRLALAKFESEAENLLPQADFLFEGDRHEVTMFVIAEPMDLDAGGGMRLMKVRYRQRSGAGEVVREEQLVDASLPARPTRGQDVPQGNVKLKTRRNFTLAENVVDFEVRYLWVPDLERDDREPPRWVEPVVAEHHEAGWGLPHGIEVTMVVADPEDEEKLTTFTTRVCVRTDRNKKTLAELNYMLGGR